MTSCPKIPAAPSCRQCGKLTRRYRNAAGHWSTNRICAKCRRSKPVDPVVLRAKLASVGLAISPFASVDRRML